MSTKTLTWMKQSTVTELHANISKNLDRYRTGNFSDLVDSTWNQKELFAYDSSEFTSLAGDSKHELNDSLILYTALASLPARLATNMNVWIPLIHTELIGYTRKRWLKTEGTDEELTTSIKTHIFRGGIGGYRDDNAAGRLWWTGYIGRLIAGSNNIARIQEVLNPFMRTTDTRSNVIERSGIFAERGLAKNISDYLAEGKLKDSGEQGTFRSFMISINLRSNGRYFGDMSKDEVFNFLDGCR